MLLQKFCNGSACNCAFAMNWSSQESAPLPQANFKIGGFSDSEAGRLNCYKALLVFACNIGIK